MPEQALLDNDVALKVACYSLVGEAIEITTIEETPPAMLGVGRFVIQGKLHRASHIANLPKVKDAFEQLLRSVILLEPDAEELSIAADLEAEAIRRDLELDGGESQLLAILTRRSCRFLITGDKRAIVAISLIASEMAANRIGCFEQLMAQLVNAVGVDVVRPLVCGEARVDRAITLCFACSRDLVSREDILAGLASYIDDLGRSAPGVLLRWDAATGEQSS